MSKPRPARIGALQGVNFSPPGQLYQAKGVSGERWKARANRLVNSMSNNPKVAKDFRPFLRDAERWLEAAMGQLAGASGGMCGPIESQALASAAWQLAYSRYWHWKIAEEPLNAKLAETASRIADAARQNALAAYDLAVRLFRHQPAQLQDPLAAFEAQMANPEPGAFDVEAFAQDDEPKDQKKSSPPSQVSSSDISLENE